MSYRPVKRVETHTSEINVGMWINLSLMVLIFVLGILFVAKPLAIELVTTFSEAAQILSGTR